MNTTEVRKGRALAEFQRMADITPRTAILEFAAAHSSIMKTSAKYFSAPQSDLNSTEVRKGRALAEFQRMADITPRTAILEFAASSLRALSADVCGGCDCTLICLVNRPSSYLTTYVLTARIFVVYRIDSLCSGAVSLASCMFYYIDISESAQISCTCTKDLL